MSDTLLAVKYAHIVRTDIVFRTLQASLSVNPVNMSPGNFRIF